MDHVFLNGRVITNGSIRPGLCWAECRAIPDCGGIQMVPVSAGHWLQACWLVQFTDFTSYSFISGKGHSVQPKNALPKCK